jgi:acetyl-CoA acetyltransferase
MVATGIGTSNYFTDSTYYRRFANNSAGETAKIIMSESGPTENHMAKITYKVNISSNQTAGVYQNAINFIAVPKY